MWFEDFRAGVLALRAHAASPQNDRAWGYNRFECRFCGIGSSGIRRLSIKEVREVALTRALQNQLSQRQPPEAKIGWTGYVLDHVAVSGGCYESTAVLDDSGGRIREFEDSQLKQAKTEVRDIRVFRVQRR